jgi:hypothetical protein
MGTKRNTETDDDKRGRRTFLWLYRINRNSKYLKIDLAVAAEITAHVNKTTHAAYPGAKTIANNIHASVRSVLRSIRRLEAGGDLRVEWGAQGRGHPNHYYPILPILDDEKSGTATPVLDDVKVASVTRKVASVTPKSGTATPLNHVFNHKENQGRSALAPTPGSSFGAGKPAAPAAVPPAAVTEDAAAAGFKEFWTVYPKKTGEAAAKREYAKALKAGTTADEINAGARRYAADPERIEQSREGDRFTKNPNNWLKDRRWTDKPAAGVTIDQHGNTVAAARPSRRNGSASAVHDAVELVKAEETARRLRLIDGGRS